MTTDDRQRKPSDLALDLPDTTDQVAQLFSLGPRALRRAWFRTVTLGEFVGFCVPAAVALLAFRQAPAVTLVAMVVAGAFEGAALGAAQAHVLKRELLGFSRADWVMATSVAAALAWLLGMLPSTLHDVWKDWPLTATVPVAVVLGSLLLSSIGLAQWIVLRRHVARAWPWVGATALAWCAGLLVFLAVTTPIWRPGQSPLLVAAVGVLGGLGMAATMAWVTGWFLARIVIRRPFGRGTTPPGAPARDWETLGESTDRFRVFDPSLVEDLPQPVQRWLLHSIAPGASLLTAADIEMTGHVRLGRAWRAFHARERISLRNGFLWATRTRLAGLPVSGFDRYTHECGEMRWRLLGRIPVMSAVDEAVSRSAAGRHAGEVLALAPAAALDPSVTWVAVDDVRANAFLDVGQETQKVTITVGPAGQLRQLEMQRWGTPPDGDFGRYRFGAVFDEEGHFEGYRIPTQVTAGWHFGTERWRAGRSVRYHVTRADFR